jgi:hypothetical protein
VCGYCPAWRARASDGVADGPWANASFQVNAVNEAPSTPRVQKPGDSAWVETLRPLLALNPSTDRDGDALSYSFQLFDPTGHDARRVLHLRGHRGRPVVCAAGST